MSNLIAILTLDLIFLSIYFILLNPDYWAKKVINRKWILMWKISCGYKTIFGTIVLSIILTVLIAFNYKTNWITGNPTGQIVGGMIIIALIVTFLSVVILNAGKSYWNTIEESLSKAFENGGSEEQKRNFYAEKNWLINGNKESRKAALDRILPPR